MEQNYCMVNIETNICDNVCVWNGNPQTWTPPENYLMLIQKDTPAKIWKLTPDGYELQIENGVGGIGFNWDGTYLITNQPEPTTIEQPISTETQDL